MAFSLAAQRPELVDRLAIVGTPAPHSKVPWIPSELQQALTAAVDDDADVARTRLTRYLAGHVPQNLRSRAALRLLSVSEADGVALREKGAVARLGGMLSEAFAQGAIGYATDITAFGLRPWEPDPSEVKSKTLLLYGSKDPLCGFRRGDWWQKRLPSARLEMVPGAGHLLILSMWERILSHLAPGSKQRARH